MCEPHYEGDTPLTALCYSHTFLFLLVSDFRCPSHHLITSQLAGRPREALPELVISWLLS